MENHQQPPQQQPPVPTTTGYPLQEDAYTNNNSNNNNNNNNQLVQQQEQQLQMFWSYQRQEIHQSTDFKNHQLPLARIKKIMKADEDVRMISAEAPILFAKACELFILELTIRSWLHAEENKRRTLQKNDIAAAITRTDIFDFLVDIVPREESRDDNITMSNMNMSLVAPGVAPASGVPYYYPPPMAPAAPGMGVGVGVGMGVGMGMGVYVPPPSQAWQGVWQGGAAATGVPADDAVFGNNAAAAANAAAHGNLDGQS
ncbi:nuclear transcription factor Y subunit C-1-like [Silene latifolia]|uniref:nuclear transcription factor Y subunit C-1-like n=1 Tax=Silene latifolia TaxID=37657 RepID=UPI003D77DE10